MLGNDAESLKMVKWMFMMILHWSAERTKDRCECNMSGGCNFENWEVTARSSSSSPPSHPCIQNF